MLQIIQNYRTGKIELADVPIPNCSSNNILVKNIASLISIGTERSIIELGKKSLLGKAKARPDLLKRFLNKAKKEGFLKTFQEALGRLDNPTPLGYSSAGIVVAVGNNIHKFSPRDRVACIGAGYASHAEYVTVPEHLCCKIPDNVSFEEASFGMLGIIALHGIRCANLTFGENVAVIGLGLLGLLSIQILKAYGCKVIGFDIDSSKVNLSKEIGIDYAFSDIEEFKNRVDKFTNGYGADAVIITASSKSNEPVNVAVEIARMKGRIV
jgi:Zn-dependent alcohol dehydrogenases